MSKRHYKPSKLNPKDFKANQQSKCDSEKERVESVVELYNHKVRQCNNAMDRAPNMDKRKEIFSHCDIETNVMEKQIMEMADDYVNACKHEESEHEKKL